MLHLAFEYFHRCLNVFFASKYKKLKIVSLIWSKDILYTIVGILVILWILGFVANIGGGLIHLLIVIAVIVFIYNLIAGKKRI